MPGDTTGIAVDMESGSNTIVYTTMEVMSIQQAVEQVAASVLNAHNKLDSLLPRSITTTTGTVNDDMKQPATTGIRDTLSELMRSAEELNTRLETITGAVGGQV